MDRSGIEAMGVGILGMMADVSCASSERRRSDRLNFETREEALVHAGQLAVLKPGTEVLIKAQDEEAQRVVFMGAGENFRGAAVLNWDDDKKLFISIVPWGAIRFLA